MSESKLRELLTDLVADIDSPPMAQQAWRAGRRSRRRRFVVAMAVAGVLLVGAGAAVADPGLVRRLPGPGTDANVGSHDASSSVSPPAPSPSAPAAPRLQAGPERAAVADLTLLPTRFAALSEPPATAVPLSGNPVSRIVAAVQRRNGPVLVLGQNGAWREADRGPGGASNQGGSPGLSLTSTSISPDARRLVLLRGDGFLLIDATTGDRRMVSVPGTVGRVDSIVWLPDGASVAVAGDHGAVLVSTRDGSYHGTEEPVHDQAVSPPNGPVVQLTASDLVTKEAGASVRRGYGTGNQVTLDEWYGAGWVNGSLAARTGFLDDGEQGTFVIDVTTAVLTHVLALPSGAAPAVRSHGCCAVLGWLDKQTVLLRDGGQVLAWNITSSAVNSVARLPGSTTQGSDPGYDTAIALAQP